MVPWHQGTTHHGTKAPWHCTLWNQGTMEPWHRNTKAPYTMEPRHRAPWRHGTKSPRTMAPRNHDTKSPKHHIYFRFKLIPDLVYFLTIYHVLLWYSSVIQWCLVSTYCFITYTALIYLFLKQTWVWVTDTDITSSLLLGLQDWVRFQSQSWSSLFLLFFDSLYSIHNLYIHYSVLTFYI